MWWWLSGRIEIKKRGHLTLPEAGDANVQFGLTNLLVSFKDSPYLYYFENHSDEFRLVWKSQTPKEVERHCIKHLSPRGHIFLQAYLKEVCVYNRELRFIHKLPSPGMMKCLLPGGERAVVTNHCSPTSRTQGIKLLVTSVTDLQKTHYQLDVPAMGPYARDDKVWVCGSDDSHLVVVLQELPFSDLYISGKGLIWSLFTIYTLYWTRNGYKLTQM